MVLDPNGSIHSLSVVIPVFNEESIIEKSVSALVDTLEEVFLDYEILVVDDGSTDGTADILSKLAASTGTLRVLRNAANRGLGAALRKGFQGAAKDLVLYIDADMPFKYAEIARAVKCLEDNQADIVAGIRVDRALEPWLRRACSSAYNGCVRLCYGVGLRDMNCAFKLIKASRLRALDLYAEGSFIGAELMVRAAYQGYRIQEFGIKYYPRDGSRSRLFRFLPILNGFWEMLKLSKVIRAQKSAASGVEPHGCR